MMNLQEKINNKTEEIILSLYTLDELVNSNVTKTKWNNAFDKFGPERIYTDYPGITEYCNMVKDLKIAHKEKSIAAEAFLAGTSNLVVSIVISGNDRMLNILELIMNYLKLKPRVKDKVFQEASKQFKNSFSDDIDEFESMMKTCKK